MGYITIVVTISQLVEVPSGGCSQKSPSQVPAAWIFTPVAGHPNHGGFLPDLLLSPKEKRG